MREGGSTSPLSQIFNVFSVIKKDEIGCAYPREIENNSIFNIEQRTVHMCRW
jgi:hypothetical protein